MKINCRKVGDECYGFRELTLLFDISRRLLESKELNKDLNPILASLVKHLEAERSFVTIFNRQNKQILIKSAYGLSESQQARGKYNLGEGIIGKVIELAKPVVIPEISKSKLFINKTKAELTKDGQELTYICVPLLLDNVVSGALSVIRIYNPKIESSEDIQLLSIVGSMIAKTARYKQEKLEELERLREENRNLQSQINETKNHNIIGNSGKMKDLFALVNRVAETNSTVLLRGESGIGKELFAEAIHNNSNRKNKSLIKVNCSALPESLIESELFGHEKGAFTGADQQRKGRFELAHGGTIFLDEIGDLPLPTQVKLLRVIQEREFERIGGSETIKTDVRIIAATNRNLEEQIEKGEYREDLYYRINVFPIFIPPLRERRDDIPTLVDHFIDKFNKKNNRKIKRITTSAINMLMVHRWPGNVRELENVIERACIMCKDDVVHSYDLPPTLQTADSTNTGLEGGMVPIIEQVETQLIRDALTTTKGNITKAAEVLKITERMLGTRIKKYEIDAWRFKV
ncbi:sigma-54 interaction domain-containing protein [Carboxylicivirga linearis]|uniref:Sigma 54-interacting transcriptional regulator n=1 Tax=Carboxylicivirga linearis TaxID=1628157 RepID=A0ABS5JRU9_9BACT|nr:sigma 54-interacting transcriptional regulator [Carboxylicivirga linearis]MBS2097611.1 sigma 54-interacting transcriptional regulator [Carboxylicivirga linearis]